MIIPDVMPLIYVSASAHDLINIWLKTAPSRVVAVHIPQHEAIHIYAINHPAPSILLGPEDWSWTPEVLN